MSEGLHADRGSMLILMPAGVLIVVLLGTLAVDSSILFLGERELSDLTAAAANDAATAALDADSFYTCGRLMVDEAEARAVAVAVTAARASDAVDVRSLDVSVRNDRSPPEVTVSASGTVRLVFAPTVAAAGRRVAARSTAVPEILGGPDGASASC